MKIVLIEPQYHIEVLINYAKILGDLGHDISVIAQVELVREMQMVFDDNTDIRYAPFDDNPPKACVQYRQIIQEANLVIVTTYFSNMRIINTIHSHCTILLVLHNVGSILNSKYFLFSGIRAKKYLLGFSLELFKDKKIIDYFTVASKSVLQYVKKRFPHYASKLIGPLNFGYIEKKEQSYNPTNKHLVIPGSVRQSHRDYILVYEALKMVYPHLNKNIRISLLGPADNAYAHRVLDLFLSLDSSYFSIKYYKNPIPYNEYNRLLTQANLALLPLKKSVSHRGGKELQGRTTWAGTLTDVIRFQMPSLIYGNYALGLDHELPHKRFLNKGELADDIRAWLDNDLIFYNPDLSKSQYDRHAVYRRFADFLQKIE